MLQQLQAEQLICWLLFLLDYECSDSLCCSSRVESSWLLLDYARSDSLHMQMVQQLNAEQLICWLLLLLLDYAYSDS